MYNSFKDTIAEAYQQVELFNEIAGNFDNVTIESLSNQLDIDYEEVIETITAFDERNDVEFLDGLVDRFVTGMGLLQKAERAGYNVAEAVKRVNLNNLSKFPSYTVNPEVPVYRSDCKHFICEEGIRPEGTTVAVNERFSVLVFKDANGKVKKPLNFVPVDLSGTYPNFLKRGG